jgi:hypothetical protein
MPLILRRLHRYNDTDIMAQRLERSKSTELRKSQLRQFGQERINEQRCEAEDQKEESWRIIGSSYVHGIMDGEEVQRRWCDAAEIFIE